MTENLNQDVTVEDADVILPENAEDIEYGFYEYEETDPMATVGVLAVGAAAIGGGIYGAKWLAKKVHLRDRIEAFKASREFQKEYFEALRNGEVEEESDKEETEED